MRDLMDLLDYADGHDGRRLDRTNHNAELVSEWLATLRGRRYATEREAPALDVLAKALHEIGGEFDDPFTPDHPAAMHNSQAAAILGIVARLSPPPVAAVAEDPE